MANNIFATDPYSQQLEKEEAQLTRRSLPGAEPAQQNDPRATLTAFEDIAIRTKAPVNVLMALTEASGVTDPQQALADADANALRMSRLMSEGQSIEDIVAAQVGDPSQAAALLARARDIDAALYPDMPKPKQASEAGTAGSFARQLGGSVVKGVGAAIEGVGRVAEEAITMPSMAVEYDRDSEGNVTGARRAENGPLTAAAQRAGDTVRGWGDTMQDGVSDDAKAALQTSMPDGDLLAPSTWTLGKDPSLKGYSMLAADVLGSFLPVVVAGVVGGPGVGLLAGGAQGSGAGAEQGRDIVREAAKDIGPDGVSALQRESAFYREALARGLTPEEALTATEDAAAQTAAMLTAPISAFGGAATAKILQGGTQAVAKRGIATRVAGTAALSGLEEGVQEAAEGVASRFGTNLGTGMDVSLTEGTFGDFMLGALGGSIPGGVAGGLQRRVVDAPDDTSDLEAEPENPNQPNGHTPGSGAFRTPPPEGLFEDPEAPTDAPFSEQADPDQPLAPEQVVAAAEQRMADLRVKAKGQTTPTGERIPPARMSKAEETEFKFLNENRQNPAELARFLSLPYVEPEKPKGALETALDANSPRLFPDIAISAPVELVDTDGEVFNGVYMGETADAVQVQIGAEVVDVPRSEFESGMAEMTAVTAKGLQAAVDPAPVPETDDLVDDGDFLNGDPAPAPQMESQPVEQPASQQAALTGEIQTEDGETVSVTDKGPWDFSTTFPAPDATKAQGKGDLSPQASVAKLQEALAKALDLRLEASEWGAIAADLDDGTIQSIPGYENITDPMEAAKMADERSEDAKYALGDIEAMLSETWGDEAVTAMADMIDQSADAIEGSKPVKPAPVAEAKPAIEETAPADPAPVEPDAEAPTEAPQLQDQWWRNIARVRHSAKALGLNKDTAPWTNKAELTKAVDKALSDKGFPDLRSPDETAPAAPEPVATTEAETGVPVPATLADNLMAEMRNPVQTHVTKKNKQLTGHILQGVTAAEAKTIDKYAFKKDGGYFVRQAAADAYALETPPTQPKADSQTASKPEIQPAAKPNPTDAEITKAAKEADPAPSDAQKEAENYKMGHTEWNGLKLSIESAKGTERSGIAPDGTKWSVKMPAHYGRIKGTVGADGDHVDVYLGVDASKTMYVQIVDQTDIDTGAFDEHKVIIGAGGKTPGDRLSMAKALYARGFSDGKGMQRMGGITEMTVSEFVEWVKTGDTKAPLTAGLGKPKTEKPKAEKPKRATKEELDHLFGADKKPASQKAKKPAGKKADATLPSGFTGKRADDTSSLTMAEQDRLAELRSKMRDKFKTQINSGLDPEMVAIAAEMGGIYIKAGARRFRDLVRAMIEDLGVSFAQAQPYARNAYNQVRDDMDLEGESIEGMDSAQEVLAQVKAMRAEIENAAKSDILDETPKDTPNDEARNSADRVEPLADAPQGQDPEVVAGGTGAASGSPSRTGDGGNSGVGTDRSSSTDSVGGRAQQPSADSTTSLSQNPAGARDGERPTSRTGDNPGNFVIEGDYALGEGTAGVKIKANLAAIRLVKELESENRFATPKEQAVLARYVGWGGLKTVFDPKKAGATDQYGKAQAELKTLLTTDEYNAAFATVRNAHYTARGVVDAMWSMMRHFGFNGGRALEPTVGTGNFLGLQPADMAASSDWYAAEMDTVTGLIARHLYPEATIMAGTPFQDAKFNDGVFDIAIGNPPFGSNTARDKRRPDLDGMKIHNYIIAKSGLHLRPGGVMAMVVTHRFLDTADPEGRAELAKRFKFLGAIRLPNDAFAANAGTEVTTDIVILQKLKADEKPDTKAAWLDTNGDIEGIRVNRYFQDNPTHIMGRSAMDGTMYGSSKEKGEYTVHGDGRDLTAAINDVIEGSWSELGGILGDRETNLEVVAATQGTSELPIGGMALVGDGVVRREMDDENGNAQEQAITEDTFWRDNGEAWDAMRRAAENLKAEAKGNVVPSKEAADMVDVAAAVSTTASGARKPKPTKADEAVYALQDALKKRDTFEWTDAHQEGLELITAATDRQRLGEKDLGRIKGLLGLRTIAHDLLNAEKTDAPNMEDLRKELNIAYDAFVGAYGFVSDPQNMNIMQGDIGLELGLEDQYTPAEPAQKADPEAGLKAVKRKPATAKKATMLEKRVAYPHKKIEKADSPEDALGISLSERGKVDLPYMASLLKTTTRDVIDSLSKGDNPRLFFDPETDAYTDAEEYLSGNVRYKLEQARERGMAANIKSLEAVQPEPLPKSRITPSIRSQWIPKEIFQEFLEELGVRAPRVGIISSIGKITADGAGTSETDLGLQFRHGDKSIIDLFRAATAGKSIKIMRSDGAGKQYVDDAATKTANALATRMTAVFQDWAYADEARAQTIVDAFNDKMNTHRQRSYDGTKYLNPVGASPKIKLRRTQKDGAWRMVLAPTVLLDHVVGAGKTFTAITGVMERRRLGLSRKPMIVVPNHLVVQWAQDFYQLYPGAKILAATPADFALKNRRRMFARIATGDYDAIIIGHSSLGYIETPAEDMKAMMDEKLAEMRSAREEARQNGENRSTLGQMASAIEKYEEKLKALSEREADEMGFDFKDMGVDYLTVDEAHEFKNLEYATAGERVVGMNDPKGSKKAFDLFAKTQGLLKRGGGLAFATGTPVSNSLVEIFTVMSYLGRAELIKRQQQNFDAWSSAYAVTETRMEYTATQKLKPRRVLASLTNLTALGQLYEQFADVITMDTLKSLYAEEVAARNKATGKNERTEFPVPKVSTGGRQLDASDISPQQAVYMDYLVARMQTIEARSRDKEYAAIDNPLWVLSDARKMSLDIRAVDPFADRDENGKVMRAARKIKAKYDAWDKDRGTQMVFSDLSTPAKQSTKDARRMISETAKVLLGDKGGKDQLKKMADKPYVEQWRELENIKNGILDDSATDGDKIDSIEEYYAKLEDPDASMSVADIGFSVYDDLRKVLIESGIPAAEIAFIHDYDDPKKKLRLFNAMNNGDVRVLIGSSAKMGAGTNAQKRLVALHHMDAPWRPSDVEQREGRIIRQGNMFYERDPKGFEVDITAYSTNGTSDTVLWQILERKSGAIETFRSASTLDTVTEEGADSDQYAEFMASSTGNPVFRHKLEAERDLTEIRAETSGKLMARSAAKRFMSEYKDRMENLGDRIKALKAATVGTASFDGKSGDPAEFTATMTKAQKAYEEAHAAWLDRRAIEDSRRAELEKKGAKNATKIMREEGVLAGAAPARPTPAQKAILAESGYARAIDAVLQAAKDLPDSEGRVRFKIGNIELELQKSKPRFTSEVGVSTYGIWVKAGKQNLSLVESDGRDPTGMPSLRGSLMPKPMTDFIASELGYREDAVARLERDMPRQKELATMEIDQSAVEDADELLQWYSLNVSIAENAADLERAERPNSYIASDFNRPLKAFTGEKQGTAERVDYEGEVYETTGLVGKGSVRGVDATGEVVMEATRQSDDAKVLLVKGKGRGEKEATMKKVLVEPAAAKVARTAQRRRSGPGGEGGVGNAIKDALYERLRVIGLSRQVTLKAVASLTGEGPDGKPMPVDGWQQGKVISVALDGADPMFTLNHEAIHALRDPALWGGEAGLFTKAEWQALVFAARKDKAAMARAKREYADLTGPQQIEEVVANHFAMWSQRASQPTSQLSKIYRKIRQVLAAIRDVFQENGALRAEDVFAAVERGDVAARATGQREGQGIVRYNRSAAQDLTSKILDAAVSAPSKAVRGTKGAAAYVKERANRDGASNALTDAMNMGQGGKYSLLGLVPGRALFSELGKVLPSSRNYLKAKEEMDALRNEWHAKTDKVAQEWRALIAEDSEKNDILMDLMHRSTIAQIDPSRSFEKRATAMHTKMAMDRTVTPDMREHARDVLDEDARREQAHKMLYDEFAALPRAYRDLFRNVRDQYSALANAHEDAVLEHIKKTAATALKKAEAKHEKQILDIELSGLAGDEAKEARDQADKLLDQAKKRSRWTQKAKIAALRAQFESNRLKGPYFPLSRFGDYFVVLRDEKGEMDSFTRFETQREQKAFIEAAKEEGLTPTSGVLSNADELRGAVDPSFIADIEELLGEAGADAKLMDDVWQRWLETLPSTSIRTNRIHRKARKGYSTDAFRAFGKQLFHGAHQLARLKYSVDLEEALTDMRTQAAKAKDANRAGLVVNEMARRHEFTMNPTGHSWAQAASSLAFIWYLGATPAAAAINISQTTVIGTPILASAFGKQGVTGAASALSKALGDFTRGRGNTMNSKRLTAGEKRALLEAERRGTIDKTQAHDLAGVAETGVEYNDFRARWMGRISWFFHHAERLNREVTFLAAYRMARADGQGQTAAIDSAADLTWKIHFDYQNTSRPRLMQNDAAKVLLVFRNFSVNMLWRLFRDSHQALRGASPKERKEARAQLLGVTGSMALHAGITGTWGYGLIMTIAGLFFPGGDDEAEERLKALLVGDGEGVGGAIRKNIAGVALNGVPGHTLGISLSQRLGMPNLWFRSSNRDLEGGEWYDYMLGELVGPVPGIAEGLVRGGRSVLDGDVMRGVETAVPKIVRDMMRSGRYLSEGVTTWKGDPIVRDVSYYQAIIQAMGFTPAQIAERYATNSRMMNMQTQIQDTRRDLMRDAGDAVMAGRRIPEKLRTKIAEFNSDYPEYPITTKTLRLSIGGRQRAKSRNEFGVQLNTKLNDRIRKSVARPIYE